MDYGHQYADKKISAVDRELKKTYRTAQKQLKEKLADFEKQFARKNKEKKKMLDAGEITQDEYRQWMTGQVFVRSRWQEQQRMINAVLLDHNRQAMNIVQNSTFDVFAENYNYNAYLAEQKMVGTFNLYNAEAVARLILGDPQLLPEWDIDKKKDYVWNQQKVNNILRQSIIQGKGIDEITQDLADGLATKNYNRMRLFARTAITEAENAGRQQQMNDAAEMGIEVKKMWIATHDNRTRDAHRGLDGEIVPYNEPFHSALGDIQRPGDPDADPANVYNCRCCMRSIYPKYDKGEKRGEGVTIDGQSYEEWKKGKKKRGEVQSVETHEKARSSVTGKDITDTWTWNKDKFQFGIQDAINARGFNGVPTILKGKEFDDALKESGIIAQRGYSADTKEQLELYKDALYNGEFFVECKGGSMFGRGMYTAVSLDGTLTDDMRQTTEHYANETGRVETFTFQPDTKLVQYDQLLKEFSGRTLYGDLYDQMMKGITAEEKPYVLTAINDSDDWASAFEARSKMSPERLDEIDNRATSLMGKAIEKSREMMVKCDGDIGVFATLRGYDGTICNADKYAVVYNRTKLIIKGD